MIGTVVNALAVLLGSALGLLYVPLAEGLASLF